MSSSRTTEPHWSLTRRMAVIFALTTSAIVLSFGLWAGYALCATLREELTDLLAHESTELVYDLEHSDGSAEAVREALDAIANSFEEPNCAFRVLDGAGRVVGESGATELFGAGSVTVEENHVVHVSDLLSATPLRAVRHVPSHDLTAELVVDAARMRGTLLRFLRSVVLALLVSLALAAVAGWYTAWRGLAGLRALVGKARSIDLGSMQAHDQRLRMRLEDAPEELQQLGTELEAMLVRIDAGLAQMRTFTAGLAHELRSPLQNLIGETEVALLSERSPDDYRALLLSNLEDLSDLSDAIDNMITWCRSSDPTRQTRLFEAFDVAAEARLRLARERRSALRDQVNLCFAAEGDTTMVGDREACLRVLRNLVANAIAWSPPGSDVMVSIVGTPDALRLVVDDRGPGIPPELGQRVFEPFVTDRKVRGRRGGYGLGLAICRAIMLEHKGSLHFEARSGGGTRFVAEFPRRSDLREPRAGEDERGGLQLTPVDVGGSRREAKPA